MISDNKLRKKLSDINLLGNIMDDAEDSHKLSLCSVTIEILLELGENRESILPISFEKFGIALEKYLKSKEHINDNVSYLICASFLKEYYLYEKYVNKNGFEQSNVYREWENFKGLHINMPSNNPVFNSSFYEDLKNEDSYLNNFYIFFGVQHKLNDKFLKRMDSEKLSYLTEFNNKKDESISELEYKKEELDSGLKHFSEKVDGLRNETNILASTLKEQKTAFNFVGLSRGFEKILESKETARILSFLFLLFIGGFILFAPFVYIEFLFSYPESIKNVEFWKLAMPFFGLEFVLLYFFRVILKHYNSIQTQIMQIELRQSLCQFIQNYAEYAKEIKEKDSASLEKFENLIFSSILSTPDKVPSTFDGIEQLSNLIKNIKG